jgi:hypothetical protein
MGDRILQELPGWSLAWSDEFDGAAGSPVDPASWQPQVGGDGWGNQELQADRLRRRGISSHATPGGRFCSDSPT